MPLTPADVANKQFKVAFRGYSLDEVDAFLDEVESELGRLLRENSQLRDGAAAAPAPVVAAEPVSSRTGEFPLPGLESQEAALRTLLLVSPMIGFGAMDFTISWVTAPLADSPNSASAPLRASASVRALVLAA